MSAPLEELLKMNREEIQSHNERPTADELRNKTQIGRASCRERV